MPLQFNSIRVIADLSDFTSYLTQTYSSGSAQPREARVMRYARADNNRLDVPTAQPGSDARRASDPCAAYKKIHILYGYRQYRRVA